MFSSVGDWIAGPLDGLRAAYFFLSQRCAGSPSKPQSGPKAGPNQPDFVAQASSEMLFAPVFGGFSKMVGPAGFEPATKGL